MCFLIMVKKHLGGRLHHEVLNKIIGKKICSILLSMKSTKLIIFLHPAMEE